MMNDHNEFGMNNCILSNLELVNNEVLYFVNFEDNNDDNNKNISIFLIYQ